MAEVDELHPLPGEIVPMDYPEHERTYHLFLRVLGIIIVAALLFLIGWLFWI